MNSLSTGFLSIDLEGKIQTHLLKDASLSKSDMIGIWISNLPETSAEENTAKTNS